MRLLMLPPGQQLNKHKQLLQGVCAWLTKFTPHPTHHEMPARVQQLSVQRKSTAHIEKVTSFTNYLKYAGGQDAEYMILTELLTNSDFFPIQITSLQDPALLCT